MSSSTTNIPQGQHLAAILQEKGTSLVIQTRTTPTPGPSELLIRAHAIALNPVDHYQRDMGFFITHYPAVLGSDIGGTVVSAGSSAPAVFKPGTRVAAFATAFYEQGKPDYGALQTHVLVPAANCTTIPDSLSFEGASLLGMAVATAWAGWWAIGVPEEIGYKAPPGEGVLVWGAGGSVGTAALQVARLLRFSKIYVTASLKHEAYLKTLGASRVFDYRSDSVVKDIIAAAREDGISVKLAYEASGAGGLTECANILAQLKGTGLGKLASARPLQEETTPKVEGVEAVFVQPSSEPKAREEHFRFVFNVWLKEKLEKGEYIPSPKEKVVDGGLEAVNKAMDELKGGVSGVKLVLQV